HGGQQLEAGNSRRAGTVDHELERFDVAARELEGIEQAGCGNDRSSMLVVVEDRYIQELFELLLDDEAVGCLDILQVNAAEAWSEVAHAVDDGFRVGRIDQQIDGINIGEAFEKGSLALHYRLCRLCPEIAKTENCRAVGNHGYQVRLVGVVVGKIFILRDRLHRHGNSGRVGQ